MESRSSAAGVRRCHKEIEGNGSFLGGCKERGFELNWIERTPIKIMYCAPESGKLLS